MNNYPGLLIVFEGVDGTGKSTQISLLAERLIKDGFNTVATRQPTDGPYGQKIRQLYQNRDQATREEELQLFIDDRKEHTEQLLLPALLEGKVVLCDRYYLSTAAYQGAAGLDPDEIIERNSFAPTPDLALLFQLPLEESLKRIIGSRGDTPNDFEQKESLEKVKKIFNEMNFPYIQPVDADQSIEKVHNKVVSLVQPLLNKL